MKNFIFLLFLSTSFSFADDSIKYLQVKNLPSDLQEYFKKKHVTQIKGQLHSNGGGFVASTAKVDSTAFVGPDALVLEKARVSGNAKISEHAAIFGDARVFGEAQVSGKTRVAGDATVYGKAKVSGDTVISGKTRISEDNTQISGKARVYGNATYGYGYYVPRTGKILERKVQVSERAEKDQPPGKTLIYGNAVISGTGKIKTIYKKAQNSRNTQNSKGNTDCSKTLKKI